MPSKASRQILNRIVIGKHLLATASPLSPNSDPLLVAQFVLAAHDASELILAALAEAIGFVPREKTTFMEYVNVIEERKGPLSLGLFFKELNGARVGFKHSGILPTAQQFHDCIEKARSCLNSASVACLGQPIEDVGLESLVEDDEARTIYAEAVNLFESGRYKESLEKLSQALREAVNSTPFVFKVSVGEPDTEAALHLLGSGVDPGMFLSLQEFLPSLDGDGNAFWDLRKTGHPANWTRENVEYCLAAALKIILLVQHVPFAPHAIPFDFVYDDVLTAKTDGVVLNVEQGGIYRLFARGSPKRKVIGALNKGQQISGHVKPAYETDSSYEWEETSFDAANIFIVSHPKGDGIEDLPPDGELIVRADLVELSHCVKDSQYIRDRFPHLFTNGDSEDRHDS